MSKLEEWSSDKRMDKKHNICSYTGFSTKDQKVVGPEHVARRPGNYFSPPPLHYYCVHPGSPHRAAAYVPPLGYPFNAFVPLTIISIHQDILLTILVLL